MASNTNYIYDRKFRLVAGPSAVQVTEFITPVPVSDELAGVGPIAYQRVVPSQGIEVTELKIEASISKQLTATVGSSDQTQIKIYNLSPESKKVLEGSNVVVMLYAGYAYHEDLPLLYSGSVQRVETVKSGQDKITTLYCQDGAAPINSAKITGTVPKGTTVEDTLKKIVGAFPGMSLGNIRTQGVANEVFHKGYSLTGFTSEELNKICRDHDLVWYVENGTINVVPRSLSIDSEVYGSYTANAIEITPQLVKGSREPMYDGSTTMPTVASKVAMKVNTFLDTRVTIDSFISMTGFDENNGNYRVTSVTHTLDSRGGPWDTTFECERV